MSVTGGLAGIRVLVLDDTHASLVVGRCLAGFGADVLRIEAAAGGVLRRSTGVLVHFGARQMSAIRDHARPIDIERLATESDVVVDLGPSPGSLLGTASVAVVRQGGASALAGATRAAGRLAALNRDADGRPGLLPGNPPEYLLGLAAAIAALRGLEIAERSGQAQRIEVSPGAALFAALPPTPAGSGRPSAAPPLARCADGWIVAAAPGAADRELYDLWRAVHQDLAWGGGRREIFHSAQEWRLPFAMVLSPHELTEDPHFQATAIRRVPSWDGRSVKVLRGPARLSRSPWQMGRPARRGEQQRLLADGWPAARSEPIPGSGRPLRVVDLTRMWSGPLCTRLLGDMGADIIRIESPAQRDVLGEGPGGEVLHRDKQRRDLDLRLPSARAELERLLAHADICVDNFSPRVLGNLGLHRSRLAVRFPHLLIVSLPAYGRGGPYDGYIGYGASAEAMSGLAVLNGGAEPRVTAGAYGDPVAALHATLAILVALRWRQRHGSGQLVEVPLVEGLVQTIGDVVAGSAPEARASRGEPSGPGDRLAADDLGETLWQLDSRGGARDGGSRISYWRDQPVGRGITG